MDEFNGMNNQKKGGTGKKILLTIACALLFGLIAGGVMVGIQAVYTNSDFAKVKAEDEDTKPSKDKDKDKDDEDKDEEEPVDYNQGDEVKMSEPLDTGDVVVTDVTQVVDTVMPSVVSIFGTYIMEESFWGYTYSYEAEGSGSGVIVAENETYLYIATNNHVVESSESLTVQFIDDSVASAVICGTDPAMDLAVIAVDLSDMDASTKDAVRLATLGNSDNLQVGEPAIAIGNALGYGQSVTTGVISAVNRAYTDDEGPLAGMENAKDKTADNVKFLIQTDAAINPGNSGGALANIRGEVIGINSSKIATTQIEGMCYAIPISTAEPILRDLMSQTPSQASKDDDDDTEKAYLGVSGVGVPAEILSLYNKDKGVYITSVFADTPAEDAGIEKGDVILEIDGQAVGNMDEMAEVLSDYEPGDKVTISILKRKGAGYVEEEVDVTLGGTN